MDKKVAIYPGSFDPFHRGHKYIVDTALSIFDEVVICVAVNPNKNGYFEPRTRINIIEAIFKTNDRVKVVQTTSLVADMAREVGACAIIKGARNGSDFESEVAQADVNKELGGIPTFVIPTHHSVSFISSTLVRSLIKAKNGSEKYVRNLMC
jgi:pantetheine-phosphate adenylyltransferase